jgi:4-diphosphocytidyl-2-C-methyl-D-erythritol kinase
MGSPWKKPAAPAEPRLLRRAPAKLNLYLHVVGRRPDGYHELDSLVCFPSLADEVSVAPAERLTLEVSGRFATQAPADAHNLALRAAQALADATGVRTGAALRLTKNLPVAAGLGGGSSDAAATLLALCELWRIELPASQLAKLALALGADVPACLFGRAVYISGIGERLQPAPRLPAAGLLLASCGAPIPTYSVFQRFRGSLSIAAPLLGAPADAKGLAELLRERRNDLEAAAREIAPEIGEVLRKLADLPGALLARMSGSGAVCFAIFSSSAEARQAERLLCAAMPSWWTAAGDLEGGSWETGSG